jgi:endonuclease/exonuclease/phosphatase family metal-dependent hydrolase
MKPLRLLCFNIHGGRSLDGRRDMGRVHNLLEDHDIDIGVFQEMETRSSYGGTPADIAALAGPARPHYFSGSALKEGEDWYGNLVVSRYPIVRAFVHHLGTSPKFEPRTAVDVAIKTPSEKIRIIGVHLSLSQPERWLEIQNLLALVDEVEEEEKSKNPVLLMGDINEWRHTSRLLRHLNRLMIPAPCGRTFPSSFPLFRLDRVWHDPPSMKVTARVLKGPAVRVLSDHLPVMIEIENWPSLG